MMFKKRLKFFFKKKKHPIKNIKLIRVNFLN